MQIRMHIIEESRAEMREMPQDWVTCKLCDKSSSKMRGPTVRRSCFECGSLMDADMNCGAIKEPRFMKNTYHLDHMDLFKQMSLDQKKITKRLVDMAENSSCDGSSDSEDQREPTPLRLC